MLSNEARKRLVIAVTDETVGSEIADAIDSGSNDQASSVAELGTTTDLSASNAALSTGDVYADSDVKDAIDGAVDALSAEVEARLDDIEAKIDELLAALVAAGIMA